MVRPALLLMAAVLCAAPVWAQYDYEAIYGKPIDVSISDLALNPEQYQRRAVRVRGRVDFTDLRSGNYLLRENLGTGVYVVPMQETAADWESNVRRWIGQQIEVTGVVELLSTTQTTSSSSNVAIRFWSFTGPEEAAPKNVVDKAKPETLEQLVSRPGSRDNQVVRVTGKFRGKNLFGDLPARSQLRPGDWVIKQDVYAVWVTGKKPKGRGWELDVDMKKDTDHWVEVIGRPVTRNGVTYLQALEVRQATEPKDAVAAAVAPPSPPPPPPRVPPVVVFTLPIAGDPVVVPGARFVVQFSKDMDAETFKGRVTLSYVPLRPGDRPFDHVSLSYDDGLRALTVDPGDVLHEGREVELRLLPGIQDVDGLELVPQKLPVEGAVEVLRYFVGS